MASNKAITGFISIAMITLWNWEVGAVESFVEEELRRARLFDDVFVT